MSHSGSFKPGQARPPGSGRKRGVPGKSTPRGKRLEAIKASGLTPLEYMLNVLRDEGADKSAQRWAAAAAAPYLHPKLAATVTADGTDLPTNMEMTDRELARRVALLLSRADNAGEVAAEAAEDVAEATAALDAFTKPSKLH